MKRLSLLAALALAPFTFASLEEHLPAGTYAVVKVADITKSRERLDAHPLGRGAGADRFKQFIAPLIEKAKAKDAKGFADFEKARDAALAHFKGEFIWAVVRTPEPLPGHMPFDFVTLADTDADEAALTAFFKDVKLFQPVPASGDAEPADADTPAVENKSADNATENTAEDDEDEAPMPTASTPKPAIPAIEAIEEEFAGVKLHLLTTKSDGNQVGLGGWAIVDKTFVYASAPNVLKELVESRKSGRKDAFADTALYKSTKDALDHHDAWLLFNTPLIAASAREQLVKSLEERKKAGKPALGGGMFDAIKTFDAMALENIEQLRIGVSLKPDDTRIDSAITWKERKGIVTLFRYKNDVAPETALAPADAIAFDAMRADLSGTLATLESMIREAFPFAAPMLDLQLDKLKNEQGLEIRSAILENFGDSIVTITGEPNVEAFAGNPEKAADMMPQVWVIGLRDETKLASFIETVLGKVAAQQTGDGKKAVFDEREILGVKVRDIKATSPGAPRLAYALHKNRLLIGKGDPALLDKVIGQLVAPKPGLAASAAHKAGLARLPEGGCVESHADLGRLIGFIGDIISRTAKQSGEGAELDAAKAPRAGDFPFVLVGKSYSSDTGVESHAVLVPKAAEEPAK